MTAEDGSARRVGELVAAAEARLESAGVPASRLEAEILMAHSLGLQRAGLLSRWRDSVPEDEASRFEASVARREGRYPLQYLTGRQEFYSLDFEVDERVLIPRPETEMIVDEVLRLAGGRRAAPGSGRASASRNEARGSDAGVNPELSRELRSMGAALEESPHGGSEAAAPSGPIVVDVGTGSGCIAIAIAVNLPEAGVLATDISAPALELAALNAQRHGVTERIQFTEGDGLEPAHAAALDGRADFVVSNPPYVPEAELDGLQRELAYEPRMALTPGPDGLAFAARLVEGAARVLRPGGWLLVELGAGSAERASVLLDPALWESVAVKPDIQGIPRLLCARRR